MKFDAQFLTQYRGNTKQSAKVTDRFGWTAVEVEIEDRMADEFRPVLSKSAGGYSGTVYHDGMNYWIEADSTNLSHHGHVGSMGGFTAYWPHKEIKDLHNFQGREQRRFFWNTFGIRFFDRPPAGHYYTLVPSNLKNYRPGTKVEWDETAFIGNRYAQYLGENTVNVDGVILCRIERPCFTGRWRAITVFTPFGGYGDPVLDYAALQKMSLDPKYMSTGNWKWEISSEELYELDRNDVDPIARSARAVFMDLFRQKSWLSQQETITKSKAAKKVSRLHDVWKSNGPSLDEDHLDDVVEVLLTIAEEGRVRSILESWVDRPIGL
ncbi:hypothetical protein [Rhizobium sp. BK176]|uniref:hypothetical protein n=1 Tax=Rhizobium sp. BK176 TaxID=2587071 RepID=UPI002167A9E6|nr:hypothetical protein [Rhizobium sp. BK176]MCS4089976.1 hypothetical protein [Rhizobium sp. BK176]